MGPGPAVSSGREAAQAALRAAEERFVANNPLSKAQHDLAVGSLPGGNTRTLLHTSPFPLCMKRGQDAYVWDLDGHKYLDLVGELSAGLLGHTHPHVQATIRRTLEETGVSLGATTQQEQALAAELCARFRLERVRMTNSGTEANLHALAAARHATGRRRVVVFSGGYHGGVLSFPAGRGAAPAPAPNTVDRADFVVVPRYNDLPLARRVIEAADDLAAVLVEPVQGAAGCIPGRREFLAGVREAARARGALFVLDEVKTSRLAPHGLGAELGLDPDLVTLGKYIGGGLAFGAFGGREAVMRAYDPRLPGGLAHSGTFNNNTLATAVARAVLADVYTPDACVRLNRAGDRLRDRLAEAARGSRLTVTGRGTLIGLHFTEDGAEAIACREDVEARERADLRDLFWFEMLEAGFWTTRRGVLALILDTPDEELDRFVGAVKAFLERHRDIMMVGCNNLTVVADDAIVSIRGQERHNQQRHSILQCEEGRPPIFPHQRQLDNPVHRQQPQHSQHPLARHHHHHHHQQQQQQQTLVMREYCMGQAEPDASDDEVLEDAPPLAEPDRPPHFPSEHGHGRHHQHQHPVFSTARILHLLVQTTELRRAVGRTAGLVERRLRICAGAAGTPGTAGTGCFFDRLAAAVDCVTDRLDGFWRAAHRADDAWGGRDAGGCPWVEAEAEVAFCAAWERVVHAYGEVVRREQALFAVGGDVGGASGAEEWWEDHLGVLAAFGDRVAGFVEWMRGV
ncbi:hypothetical protein VTH06DRAFT_5833 [Thermothelomyces fergusii]